MAALLPSDGQVLCQSGVSQEIWDLLETDKAEFTRRVKAYFALGFPHYEVVKYNRAKRIIWLRRKNSGA